MVPPRETSIRYRSGCCWRSCRRVCPYCRQRGFRPARRERQVRRRDGRHGQLVHPLAGAEAIIPQATRRDCKDVVLESAVG